MKPLVILSSLVLLTGCSVQEVADKAADAAACQALSATLGTLSQGYQEGLVDSGVVDQALELISGAGALLSDGMKQDLDALGAEIAASEGASLTRDKVESLTASITERCQNVGITVGE